jgi:3-hydroxyisobutyrate dehydrogenase-like beta-hydroxyacid dehydrogenase
MGSALAERLVDAGFEVRGYDVERAPAQRFGGAKRRALESIAALAGECRVVVIAVFTSSQAADVLRELRQAPGRCKTVICMTTMEPETIEALAESAVEAGFAMIEFPLSGNSAQVRAGEALGLLAGDAAAIEAESALLDALCSRRFGIGRPGDVARAKLAINLVLQLNRAALAEGLVFAERLGLDALAFFRVLSASAAHSDVMEVKGMKMLRNDFSPQSHIAQTLKDAHMILSESAKLGLKLPMMKTNTELLQKSIELGGPERDSSAVIDAIRLPKP